MRGAAHVLPARLLAEAEVAVQPVAEVVAVEQEGRPSGLDQPLLHRRGDRRLARAGQAREPQRGTEVAQRVPAPVPGHPGALPPDVGAALVLDARLVPLLDLRVEDDAGGHGLVGGLVDQDDAARQAVAPI